MNTLLIVLAIGIPLHIVAGFAGAMFLRWIARGESDVNGEKERDAGLIK